MTTEPANWSTIGTALALVVIAFMQVWNAHKSKVQNDRQNIHNDEQAIITRDTHTLVNSQNTAQKKVIADLAATKAQLAPSDENRKAADAAMMDYLEHVRKQRIVDRARLDDVKT